MVDFADGKAKSAFRTIGEVSEALDIKPHVLRYWEQQFSLLKPMKRSGGRRLYRPTDIEMVQEIDRLVNQEGYTLKGAEAVLRASGAGELDRRKSDRRAGDRRAGQEEDARAAISQPQQGVAPAVKEAVSKLKGVRARLAKAIEG